MTTNAQSYTDYAIASACRKLSLCVVCIQLPTSASVSIACDITLAFIAIKRPLCSLVNSVYLLCIVILILHGDNSVVQHSTVIKLS